MEPTSGQEKSSTGLDPNLAGALAYLLGFITGILLLVVEKESKFVRFHALQSTATFLVLWVLSVVLLQIPLLGWLAYVAFFPFMLLLWLFLMFKAFQGERFKLPVVGDFAEQKS